MSTPSAWIAEARHRIEDAALLAEAHRPAAALSRLYYAAHAAVTAGLAAQGIDLKSHAAAHVAFHNHVWPDGTTKTQLGRLWHYRLQVDYHLGHVESQELDAWFSWTKAFIENVGERL